MSEALKAFDVILRQLDPATCTGFGCKVCEACAIVGDALQEAAQPPAEPANSDYVLRLLIAAGHVTQAQVDQAESIARSVGEAPAEPVAWRYESETCGFVYTTGPVKPTWPWKQPTLVPLFAYPPRPEPVAFPDEELIRIARMAALLTSEKHGYLPQSLGAHKQFTPHGWVIDAMRSAVRQAAHPPHPEPLTPWQPMKTAPKDGTAVLVLLDASDIPHAARWLSGPDDRRATEETTRAGWHLTWDGSPIEEHDGPRYWMHCPDDPDETTIRAKGEQK